MRWTKLLAVAMFGFLVHWGLASRAAADPCGMVPPIYVTDNTSIVRVGDENTYVFYKDGIETFVIRPGFSGKVEDFGMLISFPSPPALRKVSEDIFPQIAKAIDPPEVVVDLRYRRELLQRFNRLANASEPSSSTAEGLRLKRDEVRVINQEAVGMYEVAVLEAGSAAALKKWMDDHGYKYPTGMDTVCEEYVKLGWCFVAEKAKVGGKANVDPKPRMKGVDTKLPTGASFDGHVQAMAFRFRTDKLILPMRLSAFNEGGMHNIVYLLTDGPRKIRSIPEEYVVRQLSGADLLRNVTQPLPLRIIGGTEAEIPQWQRDQLKTQRDPTPHNGLAKELFASDLLTIKTGKLSHQFEEDEKMLLRIGEHFALRGPEIDKLNLESLNKARDEAVKTAAGDLKNMTMTVIDGDFPREVVGAQNLIFGEFKMPARRNSAEFYDTKDKKPAGKREGVLKLGALDPLPTSYGRRTMLGLVTLGSIGLSLVGISLARKKNRRSVGAAAMSLTTVIFVASSTFAAEKKEPKTYLDKGSKLAQELVLIDSQGGFAGFSGHRWTIEPDGNWRRQPFLNKDVRKAELSGKLSGKQLQELAALLAREELLELPKQIGPDPGVNPHIFSLTFGKHESSLVLSAGAPLPEVDPKQPASDSTRRFVRIARKLQELLSKDEKPRDDKKQ